MALSREHRELIDQGDELFSKRLVVLSLWQTLAENFYPERADFTTPHQLGDEFASSLDTSYPIIARRDLADSFGAMLRRPGTHWFRHTLKREQNLDEPGRKWLEMTTRVLRNAIYDGDSGFVKATKEGDNDFATFGQCVLTSEPAFHPLRGFVLLHRCWHLRDVVWCDDAFGKIGHVQRRWEPTATQLKETFGEKNLHKEVVQACEKEPNRTFEIRHIRISNQYAGEKSQTPFTSIYIDVKNEHLIEEKGIWNGMYVIPRWKTVPGSQYAYSPAAIAALPDARLLQAMTYTLLTAGEYAVEPALVGYPEAIKGAIEVFPGGFTPLDAGYDERLGEAIRPLMKGGERAIPLGLKMNQDTRVMIAEAFYLTKLGLPEAGQGGMSPYEIQQRIEEFIRATLPLFEPMETEYNGALMEQDFDILFRAGAFGPNNQIPESLRGQETEFRFESPMRMSIDRLKGQQLTEAMQMALLTAQVEPMAVRQLDWLTAHRDAQRGIGTSAMWMKDEEVFAAEMEQAAKEQALVKSAAMMSGGAQLATEVGTATKTLKEAFSNQDGGSEKAPEKKAA